MLHSFAAACRPLSAPLKRFACLAALAALFCLSLPALAQYNPGSYGPPSGEIGKVYFDLHCGPENVPAPIYVGGTNVVAGGWVVGGKLADSTVALERYESPIKEAKLYVNDIEVASCSVPDQPNLKAYLKARWDSTHFADGTPVKVRLWGKLKSDKEDNFEKTVIVYNKYGAEYHKEFESHPDWGFSIAAGVDQAFATMKHTKVSALIPRAPEDAGKPGINYKNLNNAIEKATALHVSTHGIGNSFAHDLNADNSETRSGQTNNGAVSRSRLRREPGIPSMTVIFAAACATSATTSMSNAFKIPRDEDAPGTNKAYAGFSGDGYIRGQQKAALAFWNTLAGEKTASEAQQLASSVYTAEVKILEKNPPEWLTTEVLTAMKAAECTLIGDKKAKLHGLYDAPVGTWKKVMEAVAK